eukprot:1144000-Pelagomonas_calceolata.AAC.4
MTQSGPRFSSHGAGGLSAARGGGDTGSSQGSVWRPCRSTFIDMLTDPLGEEHAAGGTVLCCAGQPSTPGLTTTMTNALHMWMRLKTHIYQQEEGDEQGERSARRGVLLGTLKGFPSLCGSPTLAPDLRVPLLAFASLDVVVASLVMSRTERDQVCLSISAVNASVAPSTICCHRKPPTAKSAWLPHPCFWALFADLGLAGKVGWTTYGHQDGPMDLESKVTLVGGRVL